MHWSLTPLPIPHNRPNAAALTGATSPEMKLPSWAAILFAVSEVTQISNAIKRGEPQTAEELLPLVYEELRRLAAARLAHEKPGQTIDATGLVHDAYLRLIGPGVPPQWNGRGHFFAAAARAMRRILVERARNRQALKRGGGAQRLELDENLVAVNDRSHDLLAINEALEELGRHDPQAAELVTLRYFAGLGHQQAAEVLGISRRAADRLWTLARAWLFRRLYDGQAELSSSFLRANVSQSTH